MVYNCLRLSSFGKDKKTKSEGDKPETGKSGKKSHKTSSSKTRTDSIALSPQTSTSDDVFEDSEFSRQVEEIKQKHDDITDDEIDMYKEMFNQFDINGDGSVQKNELREALKSSSKREIENSEIEAIFNRLDLDNDQQISFVEFAQVVHMNQSVEKDFQNLIDAFEMIDTLETNDANRFMKQEEGEVSQKTQRDYVTVDRLFELVGGDYSDKQVFLTQAHEFCENSGEFDYRMFVRKMMSERVMKNA